jgi:integrase
MARQRGTKFQADVIINGARRRKSFDTLAEAEAYEKAIGEGKIDFDENTFVNFYKSNFEMIWGDNKAPEATRMNLQILERFIPPSTQVSAITGPYIMNLVARMKKTNVSNATINRRLSALSKLLKYAAQVELIPARPPMGFLKEAEGRDRVLSPAEEAKLFQCFEHFGMETAKAIVQFLLYTGCRLGEVFSLTRDRVQDGRVTFHYTVTKTSKTRLVPLVGPAKVGWNTVCALSDLDRPFSILPRDTFRDHWDRAREHLGFLEDDEFVPHMLRHTCASRLVSKGVPLPQVMKWMGHRNIQTTMRYSHLAPQDLDMAAKVLGEFA